MKEPQSSPEASTPSPKQSSSAEPFDSSNPKEAFRRLREEREETREKLDGLRKQALERARETIESEGHYRSVVYALTGAPGTKEVDMMFPDISSQERKAESFQIINKALEEEGARGAVSVSQVAISESDELEADERPAEDPNARIAIAVRVFAPGFKELYIQRYDIDEDGTIHWEEIDGPITDFTERRITHFDHA